MQEFHRNIDIPEIFVPYEKDYDHHVEIHIKKTLINKDFLNWLGDLGIAFQIGRFFTSCPNQEYALHIDGSFVKNCVKLNLIYDSTDSIMSWYATKKDYNGQILKNSLGEPVVYYEKDKCEELYSTSVNSNCILKGNVIHTLKNGFNNGKFRKCYSFFLLNHRTKNRLTWEEALEIFDPMIKI